MILIGIAGPSCSGKSTVAKLLAKKLDANILNLDEFWIKRKKIYVSHKGEKIRTYDNPDLYDAKRMSGYIIELRGKGFVKGTKMNLKIHELEEFSMKAKPYLIIEGFYVFTYHKLFDMFDLKFYIDIPENEILKRRKHRPLPSHVDESFMKIGLSEYKKFGSKQKDLPGVIILDGMKYPEYLKKHILKYLKKPL